MPTAANHECAQPMCGGFATRGGSCEQHTQAGARARAYGTLNSSNKLFRRLRFAFLMRHPMCVACKREAATVLDHITPHRGISKLFWEQSNWQALCHRCHGLKTAREMFGTKSENALARA